MRELKISEAFFGCHNPPLTDEEFMYLFEKSAKQRMGAQLTQAERECMAVFDETIKEWVQGGK